MRFQRSRWPQKFRNLGPSGFNYYSLPTRWWFPMFFIFTPFPLGKWSNLTCAYFSNGWLNHQLAQLISPRILSVVVILHEKTPSQPEFHNHQIIGVGLFRFYLRMACIIYTSQQKNAPPNQRDFSGGDGGGWWKSQVVISLVVVWPLSLPRNLSALRHVCALGIWWKLVPGEGLGECWLIQTIQEIHFLTKHNKSLLTLDLFFWWFFTLYHCKSPSNIIKPEFKGLYYYIFDFCPSIILCKSEKGMCSNME